MNKKSIVLGILLSAALAVGNVAFASEGFVPSWNVGEEWVLESSHKDLKADKVEWQAPIRWNFKVRAMKQVQGVECYALHVHSQNPDVREQAILYLSKEDLRPIKVIDVFSTADGMKYNERDFDPEMPQPLLSEGTLVPYDLPVFPLENESAANRAEGAFGKVREAITKKFARVRDVGGLSFKRTVSQKNKESKPQNGAAAQGARGMSTDAQPVYSIEMSEERSYNDISQTWRQGYPWSVASTKRDRKVRLIKYQSKASTTDANGGEE
jgi:hypothetical protein